jgi:hypothetical protein
MQSLAILGCLLLAGCQSMRDFAHEHPVATGFGAAILAGSIAASLNRDSNEQQPPQSAAIGPGLICTPQPNGSCR